MAILQLGPSSSGTSRGTFDRVGGTVDADVIDDGSDASGLWRTTDGPGSRAGTVGFRTGWVYPAGSRVRRVALTARIRAPRVTDDGTGIGETPAFGHEAWTTLRFGSGGGIDELEYRSSGGAPITPPWQTRTHTYTPGTSDADPAGSAWSTTGGRRNLTLTAYADAPPLAGSTGPHWDLGGIAEAVLDVTFDERPTLSDLTPSEGETVVSSPIPLGYTYADDFEQQYARRDVVYAGEVGTGSTAATLPAGTPVLDTGEVVTGSELLEVELPNGTYTRYVQVVQRFDQAQTVAPRSLWYRTVFTVLATPPPDPTLAGWTVTDRRAGRIAGTVTTPAGDGGAIPDPAAIDLERSVDGGPWVRVRSEAPTSPGATLEVVEAATPAGTIRYRVRTLSAAVDGARAVSGWVEAPAVQVGPVSSLVLAPSIASDDYDALVHLWPQASPPATTRTKVHGRFTLADGGLPVVVTADGPGGDDSVVALTVLGRWRLERLAALYALPGPVLLRDPIRRDRWVELIGWDDDPLGPTDDVWTVTLDTVEVEAPDLAIEPGPIAVTVAD